MERPRIIFYDTTGNRLGSEQLWPIPLFKGMAVSISGYAGKFSVQDWSYHIGPAEEDAGLRIVLEEH